MKKQVATKTTSAYEEEHRVEAEDFEDEFDDDQTEDGSSFDDVSDLLDGRIQLLFVFALMGISRGGFIEPLAHVHLELLGVNGGSRGEYPSEAGK